MVTLIYPSYVSFCKHRQIYIFMFFLPYIIGSILYVIFCTSLFFSLYLKKCSISVLHLKLVHLSVCKLCSSKNWLKNNFNVVSEQHFMMYIICEHAVWFKRINRKTTKVLIVVWEDHSVRIHIQNSLKIRFSIPTVICTMTSMVHVKQGKVKKYYSKLTSANTKKKKKKILL